MAKIAVPLSFLGTFTITLESDSSDPTFLEAEAKDILWRVLDGGNVDYHTESIELEATPYEVDADEGSPILFLDELRTLEEALKDEPEVQFRNHYEHCEQQWSETADSMCNDKCPVCNKEITPTSSEEIDDDDPDTASPV